MRLGNVLRNYRVIADVGIRKTARSIGISASTLSRVERGEEMDGQVLGRILVWLLAPSERRLNGGSNGKTRGKGE